MHPSITIRGCREHNLKNIDLSIPKSRLVVLTGVSGSGKSTIAFDILQKEGQRQFLEAIGMVSYNCSKPKIDSIEGLSPAISIGQHLVNRSPRSTVGTSTEIFTYLRILFARLGSRPCAACGATIPPSFGAAREEDWSLDADDDPDADAAVACPSCGARTHELTMTHFSFNKPAGACPACTGIGSVHQANLSKLLDESKSINDGAVLAWHPRYEIPRYVRALEQAALKYGKTFDAAKPVRDFEEWERDLLLYGVESRRMRTRFPGVEPPATADSGRFEGIETTLLRRHAEHADQPEYLAKLEESLITDVCPDCRGERLNAASRAVTVNGMNICEVSRLPVSSIGEWLDRAVAQLDGDARTVAAPVIEDLAGRIRRVIDVGVGYLSLDRSSPTLSAGEAQRLRLASLLGSGLTGMLYIFDEPTIGLHQRDTARLIKVLKSLRDCGNTVLVIEHDLEVMLAADHLIDIGPGAGTYGGRVVATGTPDEVKRCNESLTGARLAAPARVRRETRKGAGAFLTVRGAREHNLKGIDVAIPLGTLTALTGVSGSGKSTLAFDIIDRAGRQQFFDAGDAPGAHDAIEGWERIEKLVTIDQTPIGRVPRSNAATYTDIFTGIRNLFAGQPAAKAANLTSGHFSFNTAGGRCGHCEGAGVLTIHMHFLSDVEVRCPTCKGGRFKRDVLAVTYKEKTITDVLDMTIDDAAELFRDVPTVARKLSLLKEVGLGYLKLGQGATTLSGGEAQRIKLARELSARSKGRTLYILDEPTTGLHPHDADRLLALLEKLVDQGNTVLVVEHNLDIIAAADWVIDLGPEGGAAGGEVIAACTPEDLRNIANSWTGKSLCGKSSLIQR